MNGVPPSPGGRPSTPTAPFRQLSRHAAALARWLHLYLSLFAFATMLLFSVTGLSLNHPEWFGAGVGTTTDHSGTLDRALLGDPATDPGGATIDAPALAAALAAAHPVGAGTAELEADQGECTLAWKGPGRSADAVVDRATGRYSLSITRYGAVAILNDLHKGRDTGAIWSLVIDATAVLLTLVALTGLALIFFIRRRRTTGLVTVLLGTVIVVVLALRLVG